MMGTSYSIYEQVGVVLDEEAFQAWVEKIDPNGDMWTDDYLDQLEVKFDDIELDAPYIFDDDPKHFLKVPRLEKYGSLFEGILRFEKHLDPFLGTTGEEQGHLLSAAYEFGTVNPQLERFWSVYIG